MQIAIHWFRRDLRLQDNAALYHALKSGYPVLPIFIFDRNLLENLSDKKDRRVQFIHHQLNLLNKELARYGSTLLVSYGTPYKVWTSLLEKYNITEVYANRDYEPYAKERDQVIAEYLASEGISFKSYKDQCIFEMDEVVKADGKPYTLFTPYSKKWMEKLMIKDGFYYQPYPSVDYMQNMFALPSSTILSLEEIGFQTMKCDFPKKGIKVDILDKYSQHRDFPAVEGTSRLSVHFRFGTISIRKAVQAGLQYSPKWLNELIWRDFYMMILHHFPSVVTENFNTKYNRLEWRNNPEEFKAWCDGQTGYPIVDAGMRELNATGFMHNRLRMITASFLTKHLLIDWRWGEQYFAQKLLDYDLAANNGGWQWAAGTGTDAQPYFRVFNPSTQTEKFDKDLKYIKKWVPELHTGNYPPPIVDHTFARERAIKAFQKISKGV
ncbi:deoxyribodipyrimidine photo-lyase [Rapidithrix thailandica]|uniref:Deoxyribodipyrimidine photo-lyase n=1 Tax=Rapidithrix thailandica TaxID=413964 RepID=A0AAW9S3V3_9BACT